MGIQGKRRKKMKNENEDLKEALFEYAEQLGKNDKKKFLLKIENQEEFRKNVFDAISSIIFYYSLTIPYSYSQDEQERKILYKEFEKYKNKIEKDSKTDFKEINQMKIYFLENYEEIEEFEQLP